MEIKKIVKASESIFIPLNGKVPAIKWKTQRIPAEDVEMYDAVGAALPEGFIAVDCDSVEGVKQVENLLNLLKIKTLCYDTSKGRKHFIFKLPEGEFFEKNIGNTIKGTIFMKTENGKTYGSDIDIKGNGKGYVVIRKDGEDRVSKDAILDFIKSEKPQVAPHLLLIPSSMRISIDDYQEGSRDDTVFKNWLTKLRAKKYTKEDFVQFCVELKILKQEQETIDEKVEWAESKWNSSVNMGEVNDYAKADENNEPTEIRQTIHWKNKKGANSKVRWSWQADDIYNYEILSNILIDKYNLVTSHDDGQIWGLDGGKFRPIENFRLYIGRIIARELENVKPSLFASIAQYLEARIPEKEFMSNRFAISFLNKTIDATTMKDIIVDENKMNQNTIPHTIESLDESNYHNECKFLDEMMFGWSKGSKVIEKELYELIGLSMTKYMGREKAFFLLGTGANGKSWFLKLLTKIIGTDNVSHEDLRDLSGDRFSTSELYGKLANINFDISANVIEDPSLFKKITSGDPISAENKGQKKFRFAPYATQIYGANNIPYARELGDSDAISRRIKIITFNSIFDAKNDKEIVERENMLLSSRVIELAIIRGIKALNKALKTKWAESKESINAIAEHKKEVNHVIEFIEESNVFDGENAVDTFNRYKEWCKKYHYNPIHFTHFFKKYENAARGLGITVFKQDTGSKNKNRYKMVVEREDA